MKKLLIALACASVLLAQERITRVITAKNGNMDLIHGTIKELNVDKAVVMTGDDEHLVLSGPREQVMAFEEVARQLDMPRSAASNIQTTLYMIVASQGAASGVLPSELDPVVTQLKSLFPYKGYRLLDTFILRSRSGQGADTSGFVPSPQVSTAQITYETRFSRAAMDPTDKNRIVHFNQLQLYLRVPVSSGSGFNYVSASVKTDVDVPEGKKVVVGKTSAIEGPDSALILVISAKVVD